MRAQKWAVEATVSPTNAPQAAVVGVAITDAFELVFDTLGSTRKAENLRRRPQMAFVLGWDDGQTVQYEGVADEPTGAELARVKQVYFERFADGPTREQWPGITYVRVRPTWIRYSDFRGDGEPVIVTLEAAALRLSVHVM